MANYFKSNDVKVFPCAYRGVGINPEASSFTEYNFTNIYSKQGFEKESFVISYNANELKCVIGGYYFEINMTGYGENKLNYKYLAIKVLNKELVPFEGDQPELLDDTRTEKFLGLAGAATENSLSNATYILQIFNSDGTLCEESKRLEDIISAGTGAYAIRSYYVDNDQVILNKASGKHSITFGKNVSAENDYAVVLGEKLKSTAENQIVIGTGKATDATNITAAENDASVQVFNTGDSIYKLDKDGNETIVGNIKTNGIDEGDDYIELGKSVGVEADMLIVGETTIESPTNIYGKTTLKDELEVTKKAALKDELEVTKATKLNDALTVTVSKTIDDETTTATTTIDEKGIDTQGNISTGANLTADGAASITGQLSTANIVLNGTNVDYITASTNKLDKNGNLTIAGNITSEKIKVTKEGNNTTITLDGNATVSGKLKSSYIEETTKEVQVGNDTVDRPLIRLTSDFIEATNASLTFKDLALTNGVALTVAKKEYKDLVPDSQTDGKKVTNNNAVCFNTGIDTVGPITAYYNGDNKDYSFATFSKDTNLTSGIKFDGTAYFKQKLILGGTGYDLNIEQNAAISSYLEKAKEKKCSLWADTATYDEHGEIETPSHFITVGNAAFGGDVYFGGSIDVNSAKAMTFGDTIKINVNGTGGVIASTFGTASDLRLKQNIKSYENKNSILDLEVKEFEYINDPTHKKHIGAIAQEVQKLCPEIVYEDNAGYLSIEEPKLIYLLLNEVKELKKEIKELKGE